MFILSLSLVHYAAGEHGPNYEGRFMPSAKKVIILLVQRSCHFLGCWLAFSAEMEVA